MNASNNAIKTKVFFLIIFGIAMGFLEAAVVVYLRQIYYPEGFVFPLKTMAPGELSIEYLREISTMVMLFSIGIIAGRNFYDRFAYFIFCFGIWDIFYYVWLKILLDWPSSLLTWDILFLIPIVWIGPVLAPLICSITMILIAGCILFFQQKGYLIRIRIFDWTLLFSGAFIIFLTFIWDYLQIIINGGFIAGFSILGTDPVFQKEISSYVPSSYKWFLFIIGEILIFCFLLLFYKKIKARPMMISPLS